MDRHTKEPPVIGAGFYEASTTSSRLEEFIDGMFDKRPHRNTWFGDTNVVWGRIADGFIEEVKRLEGMNPSAIGDVVEAQLAECQRERDDYKQMKSQFANACQELMEERDGLREAMDYLLRSPAGVVPKETDKFYDGSRATFTLAATKEEEI